LGKRGQGQDELKKETSCLSREDEEWKDNHREFSIKNEQRLIIPGEL